MARNELITAYTFSGADNADLGAPDWAQVFAWNGSVRHFSTPANSFYGSGGSGPSNFSGARYIGSTTFSADHYSSVKIAQFTAAGAVAALARVSTDYDSAGQSSRDFYFLLAAKSGLTTLGKVVNGTAGYTPLVSSSSPTWSVGDRVEIEVEGTTIRGLKNGVLITAGATYEVTDTSLSSGNPGIGGYGGSSYSLGKEWSAGDLTAGASVAITSVSDSTLTNGQTGITITGTGFGASQGAGFVTISPTDDVTDASAEEQTVTAWSDTSITFTAVRGSLAYNTTMYLFVEENGGESNASGEAVSFYDPAAGLAILPRRTMFVNDIIIQY